MADLCLTNRGSLCVQLILCAKSPFRSHFFNTVAEAEARDYPESLAYSSKSNQWCNDNFTVYAFSHHNQSRAICRLLWRNTYVLVGNVQTNLSVASLRMPPWKSSLYSGDFSRYPRSSLFKSLISSNFHGWASKFPQDEDRFWVPPWAFCSVKHGWKSFLTLNSFPAHIRDFKNLKVTWHQMLAKHFWVPKTSLSCPNLALNWECKLE